MSLNQLTSSVFLLTAPTNLGLIACPNGKAIAIDTGIDESSARKLLREAAGLGLEIKYIINTHSHADHIGGNAFLHSRTHALIAAAPGEAPFIQNPALEPAFLMGGAFPWPEMQNKFLQASPSPVANFLDKGQTEINGRAIEIIPLPGHSPDQIGILVDGVFFIGDAVLDKPVLEKHGIPYNIEIAQYLNSLERLMHYQSQWYVPAHGLPTTDIGPVVEQNRAVVLSQLHMILELLSTGPQTAEELLSELCTRLKIAASNPGLFFLYRGAVLAYLVYLYRQQEITTALQQNRLYWQKL